MDKVSLIMNVISVVFAATALLTSTLLTARQARLMRNANQLPVFVDLLKELRTAEFQARRDEVWNNLGDHDASLGISDLPEPARTNARLVALFYQNLCFLLESDILDRNLVYRTLYYGFDRTWTVMEPYIYSERLIRGNRSRYCSSFEKTIQDFRAREQRRWRTEPDG